MANAILTSELISRTPYVVQKVTFDYDTVSAVLSTDLLGPTGYRSDDAGAAGSQKGPVPDEFYVVLTGNTGAVAVSVDVSFDTTNWEVDINAETEGAGAVNFFATLYMKWYTADRQDGETIGANLDSTP